MAFTAFGIKKVPGVRYMRVIGYGKEWAAGFWFCPALLLLF